MNTYIRALMLSLCIAISTVDATSYQSKRAFSIPGQEDDLDDYDAQAEWKKRNVQ